MLAEMETGEGKTLTATLPACAAALAGIPVHIITVNDYLVERDAALMGPVYAAFGLTVGTVRDGETDPDARRAAYACDVTYVTNKQIAFDYLRDRLARGDRRALLRMRLGEVLEGRPQAGGLLLRGLCYAIVDEADSVLVDEARTPLILSQQRQGSELAQTCREALGIAAKLSAGRDYRVDRRARKIELTDEGHGRTAARAQKLGGIWSGQRRREELVLQALSAEHLFLRDQQYVVRDGKVQIVDANTGRVMADRSWEAGLHQMIEAKEGCELTGQRETLARISYQQFYRRYLRLAGMTGTAREVARELRSVYGLRSVVIPPRRPRQRVARGRQITVSADAKHRAIADRVRERRQSGQPVLVGTQSVATSEALSALLREAGIPHELLNARQDAREAEIVARAGQLGRVTVATNMAGRGTDIAIAPGVTELGGLHVVVAEPSEARRIDRQLIGRCGRQGDPGSYETFASLDDALVADRAGQRLLRVLRRFAAGGPIQRRIALRYLATAQRSAERRQAHARRQLMSVEEYLEKALAFAGPTE
jgi:preprotein translocase subunit SecA